jgi:hypothetical protein
MAEIVSINRETVPEFIRRNGPTLTHEVAARFCIDQKTALATLKGLQEMGHLASRRVRYCGGDQAGSGAGYEWIAIPTGF